MPLVPAKCPICGAILNIESEKEAAVCQSCGNAFVVEKAINNYNTYNSVVNNITSDSVVVQMESEKERLNTNAETYIKLGEVQKALTIYQELVEKYPNDWRGWWGSIYYYYDNREIRALCVAGKQVELERQMASFKKIAPLEEFEKLDEIITARIEEVESILKKEATEAEIAKEKKRTECCIRLNKLVDVAICDDKKQVEALSVQLSDIQTEYEKLGYDLKQAVQKRETADRQDSNWKKTYGILDSLPYLGPIGAAIFGILGLIDGADFFMTLVVCLVIGAAGWGVLLALCLVIYLLTKRLSKNSSMKLSQAISAEEKIRSECNRLSGTIEDIEKSIMFHRKRKEYIELSREQIVDTLFLQGNDNVYKFVDKVLS